MAEPSESRGCRSMSYTHMICSSNSASPGSLHSQRSHNPCVGSLIEATHLSSTKSFQVNSCLSLHWELFPTIDNVVLYAFNLRLKGNSYLHVETLAGSAARSMYRSGSEISGRGSGRGQPRMVRGLEAWYQPAPRPPSNLSHETSPPQPLMEVTGIV